MRRSSQMVCVALVAAVVAGTPGCGSSKSGGTDAGTGGSDGPDGVGGSGGVGGVGGLGGSGGDLVCCQLPAAVIGCAATFDDQIQVLPFGVAGFCASAGTCGSHKVWVTDTVITGISCVYDSSGQQLLSALIESDAPDFCDQTSGCISYGPSINFHQDCQVLSLPLICPSPPDGGADGGGAD